jgi:hypothetical protein
MLILPGEGHRVTGTPRIRGRINIVLNRLVRSRAIISFRTNLYSRTPQDHIVITVTVRGEAEAASSRDAVEEALRPLCLDAVIRVELP